MFETTESEETGSRAWILDFLRGCEAVEVRLVAAHKSALTKAGVEKRASVQAKARELWSAAMRETPGRDRFRCPTLACLSLFAPAVCRERCLTLEAPEEYAKFGA